MLNINPDNFVLARPAKAIDSPNGPAGSGTTSPELSALRMTADIVDVQILVIDNRNLYTLVALTTPPDLVGRVAGAKCIYIAKPAVARNRVSRRSSVSDQVI